MDLSLVIPCYNEEGNVELFFDEAEKIFASSNLEYEYIFVNDGSSDNTELKLKNLYNNHPDKNIVVVNFSRNFGKESAIFAGLKNSCGDAVCLIDADLQQLPKTAFEMYNILINNTDLDCVCAFQSKRKESKIISALKSTFYKIMNAVMETEFKNGASDFRVFTAGVRDAILSMGEYHRFSKGIFSWVGFNTEYYEYQASERNSDDSKWTVMKLFKYAINGIVAFSTAPLKQAIYLGFVSTGFALVYFVVTLIRKLTSNIHVDGFTQLVILIAFFGGMILFTLGILGEYVAKIYQQSKNRPIYITKEILKHDK